MRGGLCVAEPESGGCGVAAVGDGLGDEVLALLGVGNAGEAFGNGHGELLFVDEEEEAVGPRGHVDAIFDPGFGTAEDGGEGVEVVVVVFEQGGDLVGFLERGEIGAGDVLGEFDGSALAVGA